MMTRFDEVTPYRTKDQSEIRELMHPAVHGNKHQSLAHASVTPGETTLLHKHFETEEIYFFLQGEGVMFLGEQRFAVAEGDTVCIPPGTPHSVENTGSVTLNILCSCYPPYRHEDTETLSGN